MKTLYSYAFDTKEFINKIEVDEKYGTNIPLTTEIKPLKHKEGFAVVFDKTDWIYEVDNRGKVAFNKETKEPLEIDYLGKLKDGYTFEEPKQFDKWNNELDKWVEDLEEIKKQQRQQKLQIFNDKWNDIKIAYSIIEKKAIEIKYGSEINENLEQNSFYNVDDEIPIKLENLENYHLYKTDKETISILTSKITSKYEPLDNEYWYGSLGNYPLNMLEIGVILEKANKIIQTLADTILGGTNEN